MANTIIKSESRQADTEKVLASFGITNPTKQQREQAEYIGVTSREVIKKLRGMEARR